MTVPGIFPRGAKMLLIGQAPSDEEVFEGRPFVGPAGRELNAWLHFAGLDRARLAITNVWQEKTPNGTPVASEQVERLAAEVDECSPNIIVALGADALQAISGHTDITKRRGALFRSRWGTKAIATFHPAAVLHGGGGAVRSIGIADLMKARVNADEPELQHPRRELWIFPTLDEVKEFKARYLDDAALIFVDIETNPAARQLTHIGFASDAQHAISIPFVYANASYWQTAAEEVEAVKLVREICGSPTPKALQNGMYDIQWLWAVWRVPVRNYLHDTRLMHHALYPELPKDLGFMGSLWADEQAWKLLGGRGKARKGDE